MRKKAYEPFRKCSRCEEIKPLSEYGKDKNAKYGIRSICKSCANKAANERYHARTAKIKALLAKVEQTEDAGA
jgi:superfamily II helicase